MGVNVQAPSSPGAGAPGSAVLPRQRVSPASVILRLRAYIALIVLLGIFSVLSPRVPHAGHADHPGLARRAQRDPGPGHDLRHPHRGD